MDIRGYINVVKRLGIFHGTERNNLTELLRYKVRNGMAITWGVFVSCLIKFYWFVYQLRATYVLV